MNKFTRFLSGLVVLSGLVGLIGGLVSSQPVAAQVDVIKQSCQGAEGANSALCDDGGKELIGNNSVFSTVTNIFLYVVAAVSVIMIVVGGLRYSMSNGDQAAIAGAKNTILYAVIGLIVAIMAFAIVNFVITNI